jgi:hypothetical protein
MSDPAPTPAPPAPEKEEPVTVEGAAGVICQAFEYAMRNALDGFVKRLRKEPIFASTVLYGKQPPSFAAETPPDVVAFARTVIRAAIRECATCRTCAGTGAVVVENAKQPCPVCVGPLQKSKLVVPGQNSAGGPHGR